MMDSWLFENKTLIKTYAITPAVINYLLNSYSTNANIQLNETLQKFEAINPFSLDIGVTDTNGIVLDNAKHVEIGKNIQSDLIELEVAHPGFYANQLSSVEFAFTATDCSEVVLLCTDRESVLNDHLSGQI